MGFFFFPQSRANTLVDQVCTKNIIAIIIVVVTSVYGALI